jgi:two-component system CheB/CheR fusion protein
MPPKKPKSDAKTTKQTRRGTAEGKRPATQIARKSSNSTRKRTKQPDTTTPASPPSPFPIVGVGASAGGLEAFSQLLENLPPDTGLAFVFIQHLDPGHASLLGALITRKTAMPVLEAKDGLALEADHVYVIAPNTRLSLEAGRLRVQRRRAAHALPIDEFFESLAQQHDGQAIGVVLSGNASDGTVGLQAIKAGGGITFAQDPDSAKFPTMPQNAAAGGAADFVLPPAQIAAALARLGGAPGVNPTAAGKHARALSASDGEGNLAEIVQLLQAATGVDFSDYKESTLQRRIQRRLLLSRAPSRAAYLRRLREDPAELEALFQDFLIKVTSFFRDPELYQALVKEHFPELLRHHPPDLPVRVWVPGCATGEEVYSLAIALMDVVAHQKRPKTLQLFGTDLSDESIQRARAGRYPASIAATVPPAQLQRHFIEAPGGYQVSKTVRDACVFARHNMLADPPFFRLDVVSCRNVLIYLKPVLQQRLVPMYHYALNTGGLLVLGTSENMPGSAEFFRIADKQHKIFSRKETSRRPLFDLTYRALPARPAPGAAGDGAATPARPAGGDGPSGRWAEADRLVLAKYSPPGVVVNHELEILQFRGRTAPFLEHPTGQASLGLLKMAHEHLRPALRRLLQQARAEQVAVRQEGLELLLGAGLQRLNLEVIPFSAGPQSRERHYLVLFEPVADPATTVASPARETQPAAPQPAQNRRAAELERELAATRVHLQAVIEEQDGSNEELRAAVEELQSTNEELQSTNEELQTTKEELQSANEELTTLNEELVTRNQEVGHFNADLHNLLDNVHVPILMVGRDLRVRLFTPNVASVLRIVATDISRPLGEIRPRLQLPDWEDLVAEVITTEQPVMREVQDQDNNWYAMRIRPYRALDQRVDGAVVVWIDLEQSQGQLRALSGYLNHVREEERTHMAREIHDGLAQELAGLKMQLVRWQKRAEADPAEAASALPEVLGLLDQIIERARQLSRELRPGVLDDLGLLPAMDWLLQETQRRHGLRSTFTARPENVSVPPKVATGLFRILQELLSNVVRHARATRVEVSLAAEPDRLVLRLTDNGRGIAPEEQTNGTSLGILGMRERAHLLGGTLEIQGHPRDGTTVTVTVPLRSAG